MAPETNRSTNTVPSVPGARRGVLLAARAAWLMVAAPTFAFFLAGIPLTYQSMQRVCGPEPCSSGSRLTEAHLRVLADLGLTAQSWALYATAVQVLSALVWCAIGALIFWRKPDEPVALFVSLFLFLFGMTFGDVLWVMQAAYPALRLPLDLVAALNWGALLSFFFIFPDGRFVPRWALWPMIAWIVIYAGQVYAPGTVLDKNTWPIWLVFLGLFGGLGAGVAAQIYRYRAVSGPAQRRQTRWVVYGATLAVLGYVVAVLPYLAPPGLFGGPAYDLFIDVPLSLAWSLLPLSFGVAVLRSRLWDVDRLINRTLVYAALTATLALVYGGSVVVLELLFSTVAGGESDLAVIVSTLAIAGLFQPLRRVLQERIDRRFYRRKYDAERTVAAFGQRVQSEVDVQRQVEDLVRVVDEALQPAQISLWLAGKDKG
jgi:hypothetical protein